MNLTVLFGKKLKEIRKKKNITQQYLAELCDLHPTTIGMIEVGKRTPSFATVELLANKLGVEYVEFFDYNTTPTHRNMKLRGELDKIYADLPPEAIEAFLKQAILFKPLFK